MAEPQAVILSVEEYERLRNRSAGGNDWWDRAMRNRERIERELGDRQYPDIAEMIRQMREERDAAILDHLR